MTTDRERVLLVDDDPDMLKICQDVLRRKGYEITCADTGQQALAEVRRQSFPAAVIDLVLPDIGGMEVVSAVRQADPEAIVVVITGFASLDSAIEAVRRGAYDYVRKPFEATDLSSVLTRGLERRQLIKENEQLVARLNRLNQQLEQSKGRLEDKMRIATDELNVFIELRQRLAEAPDLRTTAQYVVEAGMRLTGADSGAMLVVDGTVGLLRPIAAHKIAGNELGEKNLAVGQSILGEVALTGTPKVINDLFADPQLSEDRLAYAGIRSVLAHSLGADDTILGVIAFFDKLTGPFTEKNLNLVAVLAAQVSSVVAAMINRRSSEPGTAQQPPPDEFVDLENLVR